MVIALLWMSNLVRVGLGLVEWMLTALQNNRFLRRGALRPSWKLLSAPNTRLFGLYLPPTWRRSCFGEGAGGALAGVLCCGALVGYFGPPAQI